MDNNKRYNFWVYLAQWAITKDGKEILSSDKSNYLNIFDLRSIFVEGIFYRKIVILDHEELKIEFSHGVNFEIWGDADAYGKDSVMAYLYRDDELLSDIKFR